jgi:hypothetical protein
MTKKNKKRNNKHNSQEPLFETIGQQKQAIENLSTELLNLKEILKEQEKNIKFLKHDIHFLKKENKNLSETNLYLKSDYHNLKTKNNILQYNQDHILKFSKEYNIKDITELFDFMLKYKEKYNYELEVKKLKKEKFYLEFDINKLNFTIKKRNYKITKYHKNYIYDIFIYLIDNIKKNINYIYNLFQNGINTDLLSYIINNLYNKGQYKNPVYVCLSEDCNNIPLKTSNYCNDCLNRYEKQIQNKNNTIIYLRNLNSHSNKIFSNYQNKMLKQIRKYKYISIRNIRLNILFTILYIYINFRKRKKKH